ncbi:beta-phosphoglucomutase [Paenibacillus humicus]|uniref:beta-phosphoglucomutase n=1 Tax=Paenibacillus humicus TaxID=412861 RepID=UPI003D29E849
MKKGLKGAIFDLDGVIVDTAKYHYLAWRQLAQEYGFDISLEDNELLKGVSREQSLEIVLEIGKIKVTQEEKAKMTEKKNKKYVEYISSITEEELLPGAKEYILHLRDLGIRIGLGSASRNALFILSKLGILSLFDAVVDGNKTTKAKPNPEVFLMASRELGVNPVNCVVFEDSIAGVQAAKVAGMYVVGVGKKEHLVDSDLVVTSLVHMPLWV